MTVDTAPAYGFGRSEELVGRAVAEHAEIDRILAETVTDPIGPEFMAPPMRVAAQRDESACLA